jgi:hypothetical protein
MLLHSAERNYNDGRTIKTIYFLPGHFSKTHLYRSLVLRGLVVLMIIPESAQ